MNHIAIYINMALYSIVVHLTVTLSMRDISTPLNNFILIFIEKLWKNLTKTLAFSAESKSLKINPSFTRNV